MEAVLLDSPVSRWFLSLRCPSLNDILASPQQLYSGCLPVISTVVAAIAVARLTRPWTPIRISVVEWFLASGVAWLFLRYAWFRTFLVFRNCCVDFLEIRRDFCRQFVEPGFAMLVAGILSLLARRKTASIQLAPNYRVEGAGDGSRRERKNGNSNNSSSERSTNVSSQDGVLVPFGQLNYCPRCGQVTYETLTNPFLLGTPEMEGSIAPRALVMREESGDGSTSYNNASGSPSASRHPMKCHSCESPGGRGTNRVKFVVGPHNFTETKPKSILKEPSI